MPPNSLNPYPILSFQDADCSVGVFLSVGQYNIQCEHCTVVFAQSSNKLSGVRQAFRWRTLRRRGLPTFPHASSAPVRNTGAHDTSASDLIHPGRAPSPIPVTDAVRAGQEPETRVGSGKEGKRASRHSASACASPRRSTQHPPDGEQISRSEPGFADLPVTEHSHSSASPRGDRYMETLPCRRSDANRFTFSVLDVARRGQKAWISVSRPRQGIWRVRLCKARLKARKHS